MLRPVALYDDAIKWKHFPRYWPFVGGNSPVTGEFSAQRPVTRSFGVFFDLRLNKRLSKQSWSWWFETLSRPLRRQDDVIKWKHFPRYWPFVRGIHWSPVNSPHKGQWRGALMFSLICVWINSWINSRQAGDLRRYPAHYDVTLMSL